MPEGPQSGEGDRGNQENVARAPALSPLDATQRWQRLRWRCRRGTRELDELLLAFLAELGPTANAQTVADLEYLLQLPDPLLQRCLLAGELPPDPALTPLIDQIRRSIVRRVG
ncbi:MAG: succinate dehydrogenase assembly factor 2 [Steroidobacteraceae bacterium]|nr:succinate dehydrogenase assembly factor 2 [Steroidobacteraceae bacterium]MDW8259080.1 succinate dehydrogenase assembly factor 2 [Gammaproteobacteria bacterium]